LLTYFKHYGYTLTNVNYIYIHTNNMCAVAYACRNSELFPVAFIVSVHARDQIFVLILCIILYFILLLAVASCYFISKCLRVTRGRQM